MLILKTNLLYDKLLSTNKRREILIQKTKLSFITIMILFIQLFIFCYAEEEVQIYQGLEIKVLEIKRANSLEKAMGTLRPKKKGYEFAIIYLSIKWTENKRGIHIEKSELELIDIDGNKYEYIFGGVVQNAKEGPTSTLDIAFAVPLNTKLKTLKIKTISFDLEKFEKEKNNN